jgi:hypothetical protein
MADDEEISYTRVMHRNETIDSNPKKQQQQHSESQVKCEESSQCNDKRSVDSVENERSTENCIVERNANEQAPEQYLLHSRPTIVGSVSNESNTSSKMKNQLILNKMSEQSCVSFHSASNKSNVSSVMSMSTVHADDAYCCHTFRYDESWSIQSGTASDVSQGRAESPISVFAPASTIEFGTSGYSGDGGGGGACVNIIKVDSAISGLTTANSLPDDCSAAMTRDAGYFREGTEVNLDELPLVEEVYENAEEEDTMEQAVDMDTVVAEVEYVEEMASSDVNNILTQTTEHDLSIGANDVCVMLEDEGNQCSLRNTQDASAATDNLLGQTIREEDIAKTSFIKKLLPTQRLFARRKCNGNSSVELVTTLIVQTKNDAQRESDEFEMICASCDTAVAFAKDATVESEPQRSNDQNTKKYMLSHVRSNATVSTNDVSVFTMRSVSSEPPTEATGEALAGMFSFVAAPFQRNKRFANPAASAIEESSLLLQEEVIEGGEERGAEEEVLAHVSDYVDESLNVEMVEDDYINSPHYFKNINRELAFTKVLKAKKIIPKLSVHEGKGSNDDKFKDEIIAIGDSAPRFVCDNDGTLKSTWDGMRMKLKRWKTGQSGSGKE